MHRSKPFNDLDLARVKSLPAIKKSPKNIYNHQQSPFLFTNNLEEDINSNFGLFDELQIRKIEEPQKKPQNSNSKKEILQSKPKTKQEKLKQKIVDLKLSNKALEDEIKKLKNNDQKEKNDYLHETMSPTTKKPLFTKSEEKKDSDFIRDSSKRQKYKDSELLNIKNKLEESQSYIQSLLDDLTIFKNKNKVLEESLLKVSQMLADAEKVIKHNQSAMKTIEIKLLEKDEELKYKQTELNEVLDLLKKCDDKRKTVYEHTSIIETSIQELQNQIKSLKKNNEELAKKTEDGNLLIQNKANIIEDLINKIHASENLLEKEKRKNVLADAEQQRVKVNFLAGIEQNAQKIEKLESENKKLQEVIDSGNQYMKKMMSLASNFRKSDIVGHKIFHEITKEEALR